jgi:hypothetical protein
MDDIITVNGYRIWYSIYSKCFKATSRMLKHTSFDTQEEAIYFAENN